MSTNIPQISIIIPVYNTEKYLRECLDSVVNQTLRDIEILCVNDGSTDGSLAILREYEAKDSRIKVIDKENEGVSIARNTGLELSIGEYILFVDSDDKIDTKLCQKTYGKAIGENLDIVFFNFIYYSERKFQCHHNESKVKVFLPEMCKKQNIIPFLMIYPEVWYTIVKKEIFIKNSVFFPPGVKMAEDQLVTWKVCCLASRFGFIPENFYYYRQRDGSATYTMSYKFEEIYVAYDGIKNFLLSNPCYERFLDLFYYKTHVSCCRAFFYLSSKEEQNHCIQYMKQLMDETDHAFFTRKYLIYQKQSYLKENFLTNYFRKSFYKHINGCIFHSVLFFLLRAVRQLKSKSIS
jgi:glycosyltransferase involved in cell wall biosynthesis